MSILKNSLMAGVAAAALVVAALPASAGDIFNRSEGSIKDAPMDSGRKFEWSFNIGATSDYVFRGFSQTGEDPAIQGGVDMSYGLFYAGVWASNVDFVDGSGGANSGDANIEVDLYAGITPKLGPAEFDLGVIYYVYPGADDAPNGELDYVELKFGVSGELIKGLSTGFTYYYSPEYTGEVGNVHTFEWSAGYEFQKVGIFTPSITALLGYQVADDAAAYGPVFTGSATDDDYMYWNAGVSLAVEALTLDFRYWDTDISNAGNFCDGPFFACDERFVFSASVALP